MTVRLVSNGCRREVAVELGGESRVFELLRHAMATFRVPVGMKVVLCCESRWLQVEKTLAEAGVSLGSIVGVYVGEGGGMPVFGGLGTDDVVRRLQNITHEIALQNLYASQELAEYESKVALENDSSLEAFGAANLDIGEPKYGGEYLKKIVKLLEQSSAAPEIRTEQAEIFWRLRAVLEIRCLKDDSLCASHMEAVDSEGASRRGVFDASMDDDEVLLRLFREVDDDGNGTLSIKELLEAPLMQKAENREIGRAFRRAVGCDLQALEEALESLKVTDLASSTSGGVATSLKGNDRKKAAVQAIFNAIGPSQGPAASAASGGGAGEDGTRMVARADIDRFVKEQAQDSALGKTLEKLAASLPADGHNLDFLDIKAAARKVPRVSAARLEWVRTMGLDAALARHLPPGTLDDGCVPGVCLGLTLACPIMQEAQRRLPCISYPAKDAPCFQP